jgi:hypothetical protein
MILVARQDLRMQEEENAYEANCEPKHLQHPDAFLKDKIIDEKGKERICHHDGSTDCDRDEEQGFHPEKEVDSE